MRWRAALVFVAMPLLVHARAQRPDVDPMSLMTTPMTLLNGKQSVSQGTAFFYGLVGLDGRVQVVFLVTNYHVLTGHSPGSQSTKTGDRVRFYLHADETDLTKVVGVQMPLYTPDGEPAWITSRESPDADIALVPLPPAVYQGARTYVFTEAHTVSALKVRTASEAVLLGYPYGFFDNKNFLPIWKTGHVASEPDVDFQGKPMFLVDASVYPGMSGSPVIAVVNGAYETERGFATGRAFKLLGVFSGERLALDQKREDGIPPQAVALQLGIVWKASVIADTARAFDVSDWQTRIWSKLR